MSIDLFQNETAALEKARQAADTPCQDTNYYRQALKELIRHYERLMRETSRLIRHGDRTEAELNAVNTRLQQLSTELDYKARHDALTGTLNRGAVFALAQQCLATQAMSLILLDIDFFKRINDSFGHPTGDDVIRELVTRLRQTLGDQGAIGRVGGEEFTIVLPDTALDTALGIAESLRVAVCNHPFECLPELPVSASFGVSYCETGTDFETAYSNADEALYIAKGNGRNRVKGYTPVVPKTQDAATAPSTKA